MILSLSFYLYLLLSLVPFAQHQHCSGIDKQERDDFFAINEAGLGNKDDRTPDWKKKQAAENKKAKGYFTTTQNPDERKKKKSKLN